MTKDSSPRTECTACGAVSSGRYCAECGALKDGPCPTCQAVLKPGARFCDQCGTATSAPAQPLGASPDVPSPRGIPLPWAIGGALLLSVFAYQGGKFSGRLELPTGAPPAIDPRASGGAPVVAAPDISQMSPQERADRLYDRTMRLLAEGKRDSAAFFATMGVNHYLTLGPLDLDQRYDLGRLAEVAGDVATVRAQADTILQRDPAHLLGLILAGRAAELRNDAKARAGFDGRLLAAESAERKRNLPEYERHQNDINASLGEARDRRAKQ